MNMSGIRHSNSYAYQRFSMNVLVDTVEQDRLQGWLTVANIIDSGEVPVVLGARQVHSAAGEQVLFSYKCKNYSNTL